MSCPWVTARADSVTASVSAWVSVCTRTGDRSTWMAACDVLTSILDTPVSPELVPADEDGAISQKTEELVGPYELHDFFLFALLRLGAGPRKMLFLAGHAFEGRYDAATLRRWARVFVSRRRRSSRS